MWKSLDHAWWKQVSFWDFCKLKFEPMRKKDRPRLLNLLTFGLPGVRYWAKSLLSSLGNVLALDNCQCPFLTSFPFLVDVVWYMQILGRFTCILYRTLEWSSNSKCWHDLFICVLHHYFIHLFIWHIFMICNRFSAFWLRSSVVFIICNWRFNACRLCGSQCEFLSHCQVLVFHMLSMNLCYPRLVKEVTLWLTLF